MIVSVQKNYLALGTLEQIDQREAIIKQHVRTILLGGEQKVVDEEVVDKETSKLRKLGNNLAREYGERLVIEKRFEALEDQFAALTE